MTFAAYAFELETGAAARSARRCAGRYIEDTPQTIGRFQAKSLMQRWTLSSFEKDGA